MSREFVKSSKKLKGLVLALSIVSVVNLVLPYVFAVQVYAQETPAVQASATPELTLISILAIIIIGLQLALKIFKVSIF